MDNQCGTTLNHDYLIKHNEVVRCIHLHGCNNHEINKKN